MQSFKIKELELESYFIKCEILKLILQNIIDAAFKFINVMNVRRDLIISDLNIHAREKLFQCSECDLINHKK